MSPARIAAVALFLFLSGAFVIAAAGDYPREGGSPERAFFFVPPVSLPNETAFRMPLLRDLATSAKAAPGKFGVTSGDQAPTSPSPVQPARRKFSYPRVSRRHASDEVCYTARSYLYARESRDSDVTVPVGYRMCTPSAKFQVKSADLPR
jgi:hypothetical protein